MPTLQSFNSHYQWVLGKLDSTKTIFVFFQSLDNVINVVCVPMLLDVNLTKKCYIVAKVLHRTCRQYIESMRGVQGISKVIQCTVHQVWSVILPPVAERERERERERETTRVGLVLKVAQCMCNEAGWYSDGLGGCCWIMLELFVHVTNVALRWLVCPSQHRTISRCPAGELTSSLHATSGHLLSLDLF